MNELWPEERSPLEEVFDAAEAERRPVVCTRVYRHDGTPMDPSPIPARATIIIRRQMVKAENGRPAPGFVPIGDRGRRLEGGR